MSRTWQTCRKGPHPTKKTPIGTPKRVEYTAQQVLDELGYDNEVLFPSDTEEPPHFQIPVLLEEEEEDVFGFGPNPDLDEM